MTDLPEELVDLLEDITVQAENSWEMEDRRMKWCTVQVDKPDVEFLRKLLTEAGRA